MTPIPVNLAVEDQLSEAVLRRVLAHVDRGYVIGAAYNRGGYGYLKRTVRGWNNAAPSIPFVLLTDLDARYACPRALIDDWLPFPQHPNLLFRVAVREVEAWLLADRAGVADFLGVPVRVVPSGVDALPWRATRSRPPYLETPSLERAVAGMATRDVNARWQRDMAPFFEDLGGRRPDEGFLRLEEVFHLD